jgi:hypothetical protein
MSFLISAMCHESCHDCKTSQTSRRPALLVKHLARPATTNKHCARPIPTVTDTFRSTSHRRYPSLLVAARRTTSAFTYNQPRTSGWTTEHQGKLPRPCSRPGYRPTPYRLRSTVGIFLLSFSIQVLYSIHMGFTPMTFYHLLPRSLAPPLRHRHVIVFVSLSPMFLS